MKLKTWGLVQGLDTETEEDKDEVASLPGYIWGKLISIYAHND